MIRSTTRAWAIPAVAVLAALGACQPSDGHLALTGSGYCTPFRAANGSGSTGISQAADAPTAFEDCVHRWGYALAPARDPADEVAQAVIDACGAQLKAWSAQFTAAAPLPSDQGGADNTAVAQQMRGAQARALFYVVQARAAGCAAPPASTLTASPMG